MPGTEAEVIDFNVVALRRLRVAITTSQPLLLHHPIDHLQRGSSAPWLPLGAEYSDCHKWYRPLAVAIRLCGELLVLALRSILRNEVVKRLLHGKTKAIKRHGLRRQHVMFPLLPFVG